LAKESIAVVNGADTAQTYGMMAGRAAEATNWGKEAHVFLREMEDGCPSTWYKDKPNPGFWAYDGWGMTTIWKEGEKDQQPMGEKAIVTSYCCVLTWCFVLHIFYRILLPMAIRDSAIASTPFAKRRLTKAGSNVLAD
jgi:hypothetical protein